MKAILVLDEMPVACIDCFAYEEDKTAELWNYCNASSREIDVLGEFGEKIEPLTERPKWCPLQLISETQYCSACRWFFTSPQDGETVCRCEQSKRFGSYTNTEGHCNRWEGKHV